MSKPVKSMITRELHERYASLDSALWVELVGADGLVTNDFRRALHARQMRVEMIKNNLFERAVAEKPLGRLARELKGPAALITGGESLIDVAKLVEEWMPKIAGLKLRAALLEGEFIGPERVEQLSKMPTKHDLQCQVAGAIRSPGAKLAAAVLAGGGNIAGCLKAMVEKLEKGETIERVSAA